jgi:tRNA-dihydrouridine synthase
MTMRYTAAPMEGVTSFHYRRVHARHFPGVDRYYTPFLSPTQHHVFTPKEWKEIAPEHNEGIPVIPQLLTRNPEDFIWAANELARLGYPEVNLNLGCPSGTVVAKGKGSGFLGRPEELDRFLDQIFSAVTLPISIKTRLGLQDPAEFPRLLDIYNRYPIAELTIHPRVQKDFYKRPVHPEAFAAAFAQSKNPVCYNGDLVTVADCAALIERFPTLKAVMLGRGLIADPALIQRLKGGPPATKEQLRAFHHELYHTLAQDFGSHRNAMLRMKELWFYHIHLFEDNARYAKQLRKATDPQVYETIVDQLFRDLPLRPDTRDGWTI